MFGVPKSVSLTSLVFYFLKIKKKYFLQQFTWGFGFCWSFCCWWRQSQKRVKIGKVMSNSLKLVSGVPQGGTLSPIVFTIYTADLDQWVNSSSVFNYTDDTSSSVTHRQLELVLKLIVYFISLYCRYIGETKLSFIRSTGQEPSVLNISECKTVCTKSFDCTMFVSGPFSI